MSGRALTQVGPRLAVHDAIGSGGMASVHLGRLRTDLGFVRTVAVKRPHPHLVREDGVSAAIVDEARLMLRVQHPNIVPTLDVVRDESGVLLVMEYVQGESLAGLLETGVPLPPSVAVAIAMQVAHGLHAAHEAKDERGELLAIVHRDVSPQNVLVGVDGVARVLDFGIAKAIDRLQTTREGQLKGKLRYMPPEGLDGGGLDRRADVYALAVVLWEALTGKPMRDEASGGALVKAILMTDPPPPSAVADIPPALDAVVARGLARRREARFGTAAEFAEALAAALPPATPTLVGDEVKGRAAPALAERAAMVARVERGESPPEAQVTARRGRRAWQALAATAAAAGFLALGAAMLVMTRVPRSAPLASSTDVAPQFPSEALGASASAPVSAVVSTAEAAAASAPAAATPPRAPRTGSTARAAVRSCVPPYVIDARGVQRFKPECLR